MEHLDHPPPPEPHFNDAKMARFVLRAPSSLGNLSTDVFETRKANATTFGAL